jgi:hypothetical protein
MALQLGFAYRQGVNPVLQASDSIIKAIAFYGSSTFQVELMSFPSGAAIR